MTEQETTSMLGGCNCGEIRYMVSASPLTVYICHCHLCQKRTGSAFSLSMIIPGGSFQITQGTPKRTERRLSGGGKSVSYVCPSCHSRIHTQREGRSTINIRAGTLDDTSKIRPVAQIWTGSAQPWALVNDILSYAGQPTDQALLFAAWRASSPAANQNSEGKPL